RWSRFLRGTNSERCRERPPWRAETVGNTLRGVPAGKRNATEGVPYNSVMRFVPLKRVEREGGPMSPSRILVAGIGNIFLGDDAFGVEVVQRLAQRPQPEGVRVVDFGIRGLDLVYALLDGCEAMILVDATPRGGQAGTLYVIEPESEGAASLEA